MNGMRSTTSAPLALSNSYFTGSPPTGTSMTTLRLSGGLSPAGIRSISMARALDRSRRIGEAGIALRRKLAQIDFDKVRGRVGGNGEFAMHVGLATGFAYQGRSGPDADFVREEVDNLVMAEELGFDSVWITEHHFSDYSMSNDPLQLLTYIAVKTRHVKLGTQCIIVPWHNPVRVAEAIVNLDILSGGRAILGFGGGLAQHEFGGLGIDMTQSRDRYNDGLEMICSALETGVIEGKGIYGHIARSTL